MSDVTNFTVTTFNLFASFLLQTVLLFLIFFNLTNSTVTYKTHEQVSFLP